MDNQESLQQGLELPKPTVDSATALQGSPEQGALKELQNAGGAAGSPVPQLTSAQAAVVSQIVGDPTQSTPPVVAHTSHLAASDIDLIEKEWVNKAKEIVSRTIGDPYVQNKEINKIKADYIKKRYNKDIKIASE